MARAVEDDPLEQEDRRDARRGWLVLLAVLLSSCLFFGLVVWHVLLPIARAAWRRAAGG